MSSSTYYLKYRPRSFADLDNQHVRDLLIKIFKRGRIPHAFLFTGPRGAGKTSAARIIAKSLNCLHPKDSYEPCGQCSSCQAIERGSFLDVLEIDAASNRRIDDIRQLKEKVKLAPHQGKYKVYIIDEVHMLTSEAFNALLKTLEEPPEKIVFILCTTNPEKLPPTIISRCLEVNFGRASDEEITRSLKKVIDGEGLVLEEGVLEGIISLSDGSFRDAQKILEELSLSGKRITRAAIEKLSGLSAGNSPEKLIAIWERRGSLQEAIEEVHRVMANGGDVLLFVENLLRHLRLFLHYVWGLPDGKENPFSEEELLNKVAVFSHCFREAKSSPYPLLSLEIALKEASDYHFKKHSSSDSKGEASKKVEKARPKKKTSSPPSKKEEKLDEEKWKQILTGVKPENHSVEAFLKAAYPIGLFNDELRLGVYYSFHKECLERESSRRIVEKVATQVLGRKIRVFYELRKKKKEKNYVDKAKNHQEEDLISLAKDIFGGEQNV